MKYDAVSRNFEADGEFRLTDLDKALEINPKLDQPYYNRGMVYSKKKQYDEAILDFNIKKGLGISTYLHAK